jgi:hypothetical protein
MRQYRMVLVVLACVLFALAIGWKANAEQGRSAKPVTWEYRDGANLTIQQLNALGSEGWELTVVTSYGKDYYYILKRSK